MSTITKTLQYRLAYQNSLKAKEVYMNDDCDKYQYVFKETVDYCVNRGSHVFASFINFSNAFDSVLEAV